MRRKLVPILLMGLFLSGVVGCGSHEPESTIRQTAPSPLNKRIPSESKTKIEKKK
jgi:hypothetical protein